MADLDGRLRDLDVAGRDVDLGDLALRPGLRHVGDDLVLELGPDHVATDHLAVLGEVDAFVLHLGLVERIDLVVLRLGYAPDPEDAVLAFDHLGQGVRLHLEGGLEQAFVERAVLGQNPPEIAALVAGRDIGRDALGHVLPLGSALDVRAGVIRLRPCLGDLGRRRLERAVAHCRRDLDGPQVARRRGRRLLDQLGVDVGVADRDTLRGREVRLDAIVDDALERQALDLLGLAGEDLSSLLRLGVREPAARHLVGDAPLLLLEPPALDLQAIGELILGDRLARDAGDRREVRVVPRVADRDDEDQHRGHDDEREGEGGEEGAPVPRVPGIAGAFDNRLCSEGHGWTVIPVGMVRPAPEVDGADIVPQSRPAPGDRAGSGVTLPRDVRNQ